MSAEQIERIKKECCEYFQMIYPQITYTNASVSWMLKRYAEIHAKEFDEWKHENRWQLHISGEYYFRTFSYKDPETKTFNELYQQFEELGNIKGISDKDKQFFDEREVDGKTFIQDETLHF